MAATVTLSGDWLQNVGSVNQVVGTLNLGVYATGGVAVLPTQVGLGSYIGAPVFSAPGYTFSFVAATNKVLAYRTPAVAGTVAVTEGDVTILGGAAGTALGITADSNAGALTKAAASTRTIPRATLGFAATTATLTGTAQAVLAEVTNAVDLSAVTVSFVAFGK